MAIPIVSNLYFWALVIPVFMYVFILALVKAKGVPTFARKWPLAGRFYPIEIHVFEQRMGAFKFVKTWGRIIEQTSKWHIVETQDFGNMMVPPLKSIFHSSGGRDLMMFFSPEKGEYHPISAIEELKMYEETEIPKRDERGNIVKDETGNIVMVKSKRYIYKPYTQSQRIFRVAEDEESKQKYAKALTFWDKILPFAGFILCAVVIIIVIALYLQQGAELMKYAIEIEKLRQSAGGGAVPLPTNITW